MPPTNMLVNATLTHDALYVHRRLSLAPARGSDRMVLKFPAWFADLLGFTGGFTVTVIEDGDTAQIELGDERQTHPKNGDERVRFSRIERNSLNFDIGDEVTLEVRADSPGTFWVYSRQHKGANSVKRRTIESWLEGLSWI